MNRPLTEQKVLQRLGIEDFRHLNKEKVIEMVSMLDKMDPEVAKRALEQFPNFSATMKEVLAGYKTTLDKGLDSGSASVQEYYSTCNRIIDVLVKMLEKEDLSFEERKYVTEQMMEIQRAMGEKDSEHKKFIQNMAVLGAAAIAATSAVLAAALGNNTRVDLNRLKK